MVYKMPELDLLKLQNYCHEELRGVPVAARTLSITARRELLGRHGEAAALALIRSRLPGADIRNANEMRGNQPGYDLILDGKQRIQVKGRCWVELIDFAASPVSHSASWENDLWVMVDFGPLIDGRCGRLAANREVAPRGVIDFFIAPTAAVRNLVLRKFGSAFDGRVKLWAGKTDKYRRHQHHTPELFQFRNAFQHLDQLATAAS
jgi:hypothetical protein